MQTLLLGGVVGDSRSSAADLPPVQPVAWTKTYTGDAGRTARVFFTTLGHPEEFADANLRRLVVNGIYWALGREAAIPEGGAAIPLLAPYDPPATH